MNSRVIEVNLFDGLAAQQVFEGEGGAIAPPSSDVSGKSVRSPTTTQERSTPDPTIRRFRRGRWTVTTMRGGLGAS